MFSETVLQLFATFSMAVLQLFSTFFGAKVQLFAETAKLSCHFFAVIFSYILNRHSKRASSEAKG